ncbi:hypothetical protein T11_4563 [Trichinella zimbabwensis]|uniref:Uncharacterized protein n=1 Tax=Trichinella zimbabwensis TaxID=268475 RepID=A0A0V1HBD6_9BILA|nr:hypothetical protein T11_4563 [Trichinella zimbabwensis]
MGPYCASDRMIVNGKNECDKKNSEIQQTTQQLISPAVQMQTCANDVNDLSQIFSVPYCPAY